MLAQRRTGEPFYNGSPEHAAAIVEQLFRIATSSVCILADDLDARVYGRQEVTAVASLFLKQSNHRLRVLVEHDTFSVKHPLLTVIENEPNAELRKVLDVDAPYVVYNFALADDDSYRYEPEKNKREAIAAFGDKLGTESLRRTFDVIWNRAEVIDKRPVSQPTFTLG